MCKIPSSIGGALAGKMSAQYTDEIDKPLETQFSCELRLGSKSGGNSTSTSPLFNIELGLV